VTTLRLPSATACLTESSAVAARNPAPHSAKPCIRRTDSPCPRPVRNYPRQAINRCTISLNPIEREQPEKGIAPPSKKANGDRNNEVSLCLSPGASQKATLDPPSAWPPFEKHLAAYAACGNRSGAALGRSVRRRPDRLHPVQHAFALNHQNQGPTFTHARPQQ